MALVLQLLTGGPYRLLAVASVVALVITVWVLPFKWIERVFGLLGLTMLGLRAAAVALHPPWREVPAGSFRSFRCAAGRERPARVRLFRRSRSPAR